jgi:NAD(P)-dependent dehydrogenase (short-subunit alcohol dehydrogenase family)/acyl dehydratase
VSAPIRFSSEELELFSAASQDRNPLHLDESHARRSPFGGRVVFGALGAIAGLGRIAARPGQTLASLTVEFPSPIQLGVECAVEVSEAAERAQVKLHDGKRLLLRATAVFRAGASRPLPGEPRFAAVPGEAARLEIAALQPGRSLELPWTPGWAALAALEERYRLASRGLGPLELATLCASSYLVGMQLPGQRALFSRAVLRFEAGQGALATPFSLSARVVGFDPRFDLLSTRAELSAGGETLCRAELQAFVRQEIVHGDAASLAALLPAGEGLAGQLAVVVGASRGLGAGLAQALALQGATVLASYRKNRTEAEKLAASLPSGAGRILPFEGDAADPAFCASLRARVLELGGTAGLEILILNACPPLLPLWIEPGSLSRLQDHVNESLALCAAPMSALLDLCAARAGCCVVVSSSAVRAPLPEWPHYLAAKGALEALTGVAALEYPAASFVVLRPPRLLTDLTNTPLGRQSAIPPARVAAAVVRQILARPTAGAVSLLEEIP